MFIGHFAVAFAAKRAAPEASLGWLFAAGQLIDLIWPILLLVGWERAEIDPGNTAFTPLAFTSYPYTHSLLLTLAWAAGFGALVLWLTKRRRAALVCAALVVSHWLLDLVTHRPDLPLAPGSAARYGLGLWNSVAATLLLEGALFALGVWLYAGATRARNRRGVWTLWSLVAVLAILYLVNAASPPPPSMDAVAYAGLLLWLFPLWAGWADRNRVAARQAAT